MTEQREMVLYIRRGSFRCWRARRLLSRRGYRVEVVDATNGAAARVTLKQLAYSDYRETVPYLFVDRRPVGGLRDVKALDRSGDLERLVRGEV
ncbi:MAG TPA: glutaredoxin domain-containing protein [Rubrobacteraceae bacterium]|jgi:glutaredoxin|nr:glutaredoxin domain-containing protein [Rubrobacteraceae bacterium]